MSMHKQDYVNFFSNLWNKFLASIGHPAAVVVPAPLAPAAVAPAPVAAAPVVAPVVAVSAPAPVIQGEQQMLDQSASLVAFSHTGGGHTQHQPAVRSLTADGLRVVAFIKSLKDVRQQAAVTTAFTRMGLQVTDAMTLEAFNGVMAGNGPPRYNFHTGEYFDYGQATTGGVVICTDQTLLVAKNSRKPA